LWSGIATRTRRQHISGQVVMNILWKLCTIIGMLLIISAISKQEKEELNRLQETNEETGDGNV